MPKFFEIVCQTLDEIHDTFLVVSISKRSAEKQDTDQLKAGIFVGWGERSASLGVGFC